MRGLGRRGKKNGAEGCGVEEGCDGSVGERRGSESREREGRIGQGSLGEGREGEWMHTWK